MRPRILNPFNTGRQAPGRDASTPEGGLVAVRLLKAGRYHQRQHEAGEVVWLSPDVADLVVRHREGAFLDDRQAPPSRTAIRYRGGSS